MNLPNYSEFIGWIVGAGGAFAAHWVARMSEKREKELEISREAVLRANHNLAKALGEETNLRQEIQRQLDIRKEKLREIRLRAWRLTNGHQSLDCVCIACQSFNILKDLELEQSENDGGAR